MNPRKIVYFLGGTVLLLLLAVAGADAYIAYRLPKLLNRENDSPYQISYRDVDVALLTGSVSAQGITVRPRTDTAASLHATVKSIEITGVQIFSLLFSDRIRARTLLVNTPKITLIQQKTRKKPVRDDAVQPFSKIIHVNDIVLRNGHFTMLNAQKTPVLFARRLSIRIDGITISENTLDETVPFRYTSYAWSCDSLYYRAGKHYDVTIGHIGESEKKLTVHHLHYKPRISKTAFRSLPMEKDRYDIRARSVTADTLQWFFKGDRIHINISKLQIDAATGNIFRSKLPPDDLSRKKMYGELLRNMNPHLTIGSLHISRSRVQYEEEKTAAKGAGKIWFSNLNLTTGKITGGRNRADLVNLQIKASALLMGKARTEIDWTVGLTPDDAFTLRGRILDFPANALVPFSKPYMNATFSGDLDGVYFNFAGSRSGVSGDFAMTYDNLKVQLYRKKKPDKKNKLVSALANLLIKNDTNRELATTQISVPRIKKKSFFNLWWRGLQEGLKKIVL